MDNNRRKYKIYVNDHPIILASIQERPRLHEEMDEDVLFLPWMGRQKTIFNCVDLLMKGGKKGVVFLGENPRKMWDFFRSVYPNIIACGGLVKHENTLEVLMIFRRGHWDLPKGKQEKGETRAQTAVREVMEETGLQKVFLGEKIGKTYHIYLTRGGRKILKTSYWFEMTTAQSDFIPQVEEDIEKIEWMTMDAALNARPIYGNILSFLQSVSSLHEGDRPMGPSAGDPVIS